MFGCARSASPLYLGVFADDRSRAYDNLFLTVSNYFMCFSDLAPEAGAFVKYWSKREYNAYLERYVAHFGLGDAIRFDTEVRGATFDPATRRWTVEASDGSRRDFDAVVVATGSNGVPCVPDVAKNFKGLTLHSSEYREPSRFVGLDVVVVGAGESAADIASEVCEGGARRCVMWSRRAQLMAPRFPTLMSEDGTHDEFACISDDARARNIELSDFLEYHTVSRFVNESPLWLFGLVRQLFWRFKMLDTKNKTFANLCSLAIHGTLEGKAFLPADQAMWITKNGRAHKFMAEDRLEFLVSPTATFHEASVTFPAVSYHKRRTFAPPIAVDVACGAVVFCTGYVTDVPFLAKDCCERDPRTWYKNCFPAGDLGHSLAFLGWARPQEGGIPVCAEMLARYHALLVAGERHLPEDATAIARNEGRDSARYYYVTPNLKSLVAYNPFMESVAKLIGCTPRRPSVLSEPCRFLMYWFYPQWSYWYRERGPGAAPDVLDGVLDRFPLRKKGVFSAKHGVPVPTVLHVLFALFQKPINFLSLAAATLFPSVAAPGVPAKGTAYQFNKSKAFILHGEKMKWSNLISP